LKDRFRKNVRIINKVLIFALSLLFIFLGGSDAADLNIKWMVGWNHSSLDNKDIDGINRITSGFGLEYWIIKNLGLEIDAIYVVKGYYCYLCDIDKVFTEISIPLLIKGRVLFWEGLSL